MMRFRESRGQAERSCDTAVYVFGIVPGDVNARESRPRRWGGALQPDRTPSRPEGQQAHGGKRTFAGMGSLSHCGNTWLGPRFGDRHIGRSLTSGFRRFRPGTCALIGGL